MRNFNRVGFGLIITTAAFVLSGCNGSTNSVTCTISPSASGETINCPDGSSAVISNGQSGANGDQGTQGSQGLGSGIFSSVIPSDDQRCLQGNGGVAYSTFIDYNNTGIFESNDVVTSTNYICNGATGATGATGSAGSSSSVSLLAATSNQCANGGWMITVTNSGEASESYPLCNGATGATGATGAAAPASPLSLVQLIAPCGDASSAWKEELLLLSDGSLLADFSDNSSGDETRLSLIPDGSYEDTDDSGCIFSISTSNGTRSITWGAGSSGDDPSGWAAGGWEWTTPVASTGAVAIN